MNKLMRSRRNKMVAGVIAGIAETYHIDIDLGLLRIIFAAACLFMGFPIVVYILAAVILPEEN